MKYLKCAGVALVPDLILGSVISAVVEEDKAVENFFVGFFVSLLLTTIPAIGPTAIDRLVHQNLFDNKPLQYGLTALESFGLNVVAAGLMGNNKQTFTQNVKDYFSDLIKMDLSEDSIATKYCFFSSIAKACAFKYILDSADEQPEIDNSQDNHIEDTSVSQMIEVL
jgi:hypothetical protein